MSIKQGEYLKKLRTEKGLSQDALGEVLGISRQSVSKWEQGNSTPDIDNIGKLAEFYGVSIDSLVKGEAQEEEAENATAESEEEKAVNELIDEFTGKAENEEKEEQQETQLSAPQPSLKEKELLEEQRKKRIFTKGKESERKEKGKEKKKLAVSVVSRAGSYCILLNRYIFGCKRLENGLDSAFDNSSFLYRYNCR